MVEKQFAEQTKPLTQQNQQNQQKVLVVVFTRLLFLLLVITQYLPNNEICDNLITTHAATKSNDGNL